MTVEELEAVKVAEERAALAAAAKTDKIVNDLLKPHVGESVYYYTGLGNRGQGEDVWRHPRAAVVIDTTREAEGDYGLLVLNGTEMDPGRSATEQRPRVKWLSASPIFEKPCPIEYCVPKGIGPRQHGGAK